MQKSKTRKKKTGPTLAQLKLQLEFTQLALEVKDLERKEALAAAGEKAATNYQFYDEVTDTSVKACMEELSYVHVLFPEAPLSITFHSPGGGVLDGLALFDFLIYLRSQKHHLTITAFGQASSMGAVLLQAADKRIISKHGFILVHEISGSVDGSTTGTRDYLKSTTAMEDQLFEILAERSKLSVRKLRKMCLRKDLWLNAKKALEHGLVDEIL